MHPLRSTEGPLQRLADDKHIARIVVRFIFLSIAIRCINASLPDRAEKMAVPEVVEGNTGDVSLGLMPFNHRRMVPILGLSCYLRRNPPERDAS